MRSKLVDQYIAEQPAHVRPVLKRVRAVIQKAVPGLEEGISYRIPVYKLDGELVIYFAGWTEHYSLYPALDAAQAFARELTGYEVSRGTIRIPLGEVPDKLITAVVKFRAKLAAERRKLKAARKAAKRADRPKAKAPAKAAKTKARRGGSSRPARGSRRAATR